MFGTWEGSDVLCHMKKITENHIVQNVLVEKDICNFTEYIYQMTGDRKKRMIRQLRFFVTVVSNLVNSQEVF